MPMTQVTPAPRKLKHALPTSNVQSIREVTKVKNRIQPRKELTEALLLEFVKAINDACDSGALPYTNYRLNQSGSPNKVHAHYMCNVLDPIYRETAKKMAQKDKTTIEEAWESLKTRLLDRRKFGMAFILTSDGKKFWYMPTGAYNTADGETRKNLEPMLYHDWEKKGYTSEEKALITKMRKLVQPGKVDELLSALGKVE